MTKETQQWLESNIRVGFTKQRGNAWWYEGDTQSHYTGEVPEEEVKRLLGFPVVESPVYVNVEPDSTGKLVVPDKKAIIRGDTGEVFNITASGYQVHPLTEWLYDSVYQMLDGGVGVGSVGLLNGGRVAFVQMELPENQRGPNGEDFRPFVAATTSLDSSLATEYQRGTTRIVCDNTRSAFFAHGGGLKKRHTKNSSVKPQELRDHLGIALEQISEDYIAEIEALTSKDVSERQWAAFLNEYAPIPENPGRGQTMARNKQDALMGLWESDDRVPAGTEWGVLQAVNTYNQHVRTVKEVDRVERNYMNLLEGKTAKEDRTTLEVLDRVLSRA